MTDVIPWGKKNKTFYVQQKTNKGPQNVKAPNETNSSKKLASDLCHAMVYLLTVENNFFFISFNVASSLLEIPTSLQQNLSNS